MVEIVVITGAGAGVGRAAVRAFARQGCDLGLIGRDQGRLDAAAAEAGDLGVRACVAIADVADADAVEAAAEAIEQALGPITVWVNNAMTTIVCPVSEITPAELRRGTEVTYFGTVHGTLSALKRMRRRGRGTIVNVGSALAYRSIPLQSVYCGAKSAVRGFTDSLRSEILHDGDDIHLTMVHLPAINTPQFDWALNRTGYRAQPVAPVFAPEVAADAIVRAALGGRRRREWWVGWPTVKAVLGTRIAAGLLDRYLASSGYTGQLTKEARPDDAPSNFYEPVAGTQGAEGRFDTPVPARAGAGPARQLVVAATVGVVGLVSAGLLRRAVRRAEGTP